VRREALAELSTQTKDVEQLTELVRERLAPHITTRVKGADGSVAALTLDPRVEEVLRRSLRDIATGAGGALDPELLRALTVSAETAASKFVPLGAPPILVAPPDLRRYARAIFERKLPQLAVVSYREIDPGVPLRVLDRIQTAQAFAQVAGGPSTP
jgi:flagellar biosynthesis protein FlhA